MKFTKAARELSYMSSNAVRDYICNNWPASSEDIIACLAQAITAAADQTWSTQNVIRASILLKSKLWITIVVDPKALPRRSVYCRLPQVDDVMRSLPLPYGPANFRITIPANSHPGNGTAQVVINLNNGTISYEGNEELFPSIEEEIQSWCKQDSSSSHVVLLKPKNEI